jgi:hypothetical protein
MEITIMGNKKRTKLVLLAQHGRLGNRLWTYANVLAYAMEHNFCVYNPLFDSEENNFANSNDRKSILNYALPFLSRINLKVKLYPSIILKDGWLLSLDNVLPDVLHQNNVNFLFGFYFYAPQCLEKHSDYIRNFFMPNQLATQNIKQLVNKAKQDSEVLIGVHIRHGDYKTYCDGIMFYSVVEYVQVMRCLKDQFADKKVSFIICSDEKHDLSEYSELNIYYGCGGVIEDLYTLASCDYIFGPNSSFSHWASFFGKVPLHVLDYKAEINRGDTPITSPLITDNFEIFTPQRFGTYASRIVDISQFISI